MILLPFMLIFMSVGLLIIIANWKIYTKAGQPGWASIIPIYNIYILLKIIGKPWWWLLLMLIPFVNIIWGIWMLNLLSLSFGKSSAFTIGLIFLPFIFYPILGFGDSQYNGPSAGNPSIQPA